MNFFTFQSNNTKPNTAQDYLVSWCHFEQPHPPFALVDKTFCHCSHIFNRNDGACSTFERLCAGPYRVVERQDKYFTVDLGIEYDRISIDSLKQQKIWNGRHDLSPAFFPPPKSTACKLFYPCYEQLPRSLSYKGIY